MKTCVILSGAGISADSGLKTFRDDGGLWRTHRVQDVASPEAFRRTPQLVLDFYNERRRLMRQAEPNPAHLALVKLEQAYRVVIVTQNVDDLHERAGSSNVVHLHGELTKLRSTKDPNYIIDWPGDQTLDDVDPNGFALRPHIVWFGESVPELERAAAIVQQADYLLIIGTSMQVYPAAGLVHYTPRHCKTYLVDPHPAPLKNVHTIAEKAKDGVPKLVDILLQAAS